MIRIAVDATRVTTAGSASRADDLTNIRMPGSAPFHMKVAFHAYPGIDFCQARQIHHRHR